MKKFLSILSIVVLILVSIGSASYIAYEKVEEQKAEEEWEKKEKEIIDFAKNGSLGVNSLPYESFAVFKCSNITWYDDVEEVYLVYQFVGTNMNFAYVTIDDQGNLNGAGLDLFRRVAR